MLRISLFLIFFAFLFADVKIYAPYSKEVNNSVILKKPYMIYKDFYIQSDRAVVKNNKTAIFEGNVVIFYNDEVIKAKKVEVLSKENIVINDSYLYDRKLDVWFKNKIANIEDKNIVYFKDGIFSSCCVKNPDWFIHTTSGNFNKKTKYIKLYNLTLYIHKTPVFYLPFYFGSLDKTRRSGLLRPYLGYSSNEGLLYSQPIYFVTSVRNDLEITPTIRNLRGRGIYSTFRFVDSPYSYGEIKVGIFKDKSYFYKKNNLAHQSHYGYEFYYLRNKVTKNDKLYMDLKYANDVDFYYLNPFNYTFDTSYLTDTLITSKLNYIKEFKGSILGIYNRYYIDTTKLSNKDTMQTIPQINYHIYEKKYWKFLTSFDYNFYYNFNMDNFRYYTNTFSFPLSFDFHMFDNYLNFKASEIFNGEYSKQRHSNLPASFYLNGYSEFKLYTSLTKYGTFLHIINPALIFTHRNFSRKDIKTPSIITYSEINDNISFNLFQIFEYKDLYLDHTFNQIYNSNIKKFTKMENLINMKFKGITLSDNNKYDWQSDSVEYNAFNLGFLLLKNNFEISHIYQKFPRTKTIDFKISRNINPYKTLYFKYNYDILNRYAKYWIVGVKLNKKCWQYDISFKKNIFPVLENSGISYKTDNIIYFYINFYPIGGVKQTFLYKGS